MNAVENIVANGEYQGGDMFIKFKIYFVNINEENKKSWLNKKYTFDKAKKTLSEKFLFSFLNNVNKK